MDFLSFRKPRRRFARSRRSTFRTALDWLLVFAFFSLVGLVVVRFERLQIRETAGVVVVHDGDTLSQAGERIRLAGIDAFEYDQTCSRGSRAYACGREATAALRALVKRGVVSCRGRTRDRYDRLLAVCEAGGTELNEALVNAGWAVAYGDYEEVEAAARRDGRGAWAGEFERPSDWRARKDGAVEYPHELWRWLVDLLRQLLR